MKQWIAVVLVSSLISSHVAFAQAQAPSYPYPELTVTPRASEVLLREAKKEESQVWTTYLPVQSSALLTLTAGILTMGDKDPEVPDGPKDEEDSKEKEDLANAMGLIGVGVGGGWLLTTIAMSAAYRPYKSCYKDMRKMPAGNKREALARERSAEECLYDAAAMGSRMAWLAFASNFAASVVMSAAALEDLTQGVTAVAIVGSFAPLLFDLYWEDVADYHDEYKKRVYGPVARANVGLLYNEQSRKLAPALTAGISW